MVLHCWKADCLVLLCRTPRCWTDNQVLPLQALSQWMADRAVLPVENSLGGSIHLVFDLLLRYRLHIVGEVSVEVNHCLMALPGTKKEDVKRVMSHPQVGTGQASTMMPSCTSCAVTCLPARYEAGWPQLLGLAVMCGLSIPWADWASQL